MVTNKRQNLILIFPLLVVCGTFVSGKTTDVALVQGESLQQLLLADAGDGTLDDFTLLDAALVAGGVDGEDLRRRRDRFEEFCSELENVGDITGAPRQRAEAIFRFMHQRVLTGGYSTHCSELDRALEEGRFNCVSSTLLYHCICQRFGLNPTAVALPAHVFSRFQSGPFDVETTCPNWFDRAWEHAQPSGVGASGPLHATSQAEAKAREITPVALLGKVYYNIGVAGLEQGQFADALRALRTSIRLDPADEAARANMLAAINNWSLAECQAGRFSRAADLLTEGLSLAPDYPPFRANDLHIHRNWALSLCDEGRYAEASDLLERCYLRRPEADLFDRGRLAVYAAWGQSLLTAGREDQGWEVLADARRRFPGRREMLDYEAAAIGAAVDQLTRQDRRSQALDLLVRGLALQPDCALLRKQQEDLTGRQ